MSVCEVNKERCDTCRYWERIDSISPGLGACRRHAPRPIKSKERGQSSDDYMFCTWTVTGEDDWCGEYKFVGEAWGTKCLDCGNAVTGLNNGMVIGTPCEHSKQ
jgi:hypothetical protein